MDFNVVMNVKLVPWTPPNYVMAERPPRPRQEGLGEAMKWHLREIDAETLSALCDQFRAEVFRKAEKADPRMR